MYAHNVHIQSAAAETWFYKTDWSYAT